MAKELQVKLVFYRTLFSQSAASLTMGSLAAYLEQNNISAQLCLMARRGLHNAESLMFHPKAVKVIIAKPNFKDLTLMLPILEELKLQGLADRIFFCGPFPSLNAKDLMSRHVWLDGIILGLIEETALELIKTIKQDGKFSSDCAGGLWRDCVSGKLTEYKPKPCKLKLDDLPFPSRTIEKEERGLFINLEASRGCSGQCSFCHVPVMGRLAGQSGIDYRRPALVVGEMEQLQRSLGKELFIFNDSCFWRGPQDDARILEFCREIKRRKLSIKFYIYLKCRPSLPDNILKALAEAGLVRVFLGIENAADRSQKIFNKKIDLGDYENIKKRFDKFHINIHIGYIVAEPYTTLKDVDSNLRYLRKIGKLFRIGVILEAVRVIPGSELHRRLLKDRLIKKDLPAEQITYGYSYQDKSTGKLMSEIKNFFAVTLQDDSYSFEYYCTTIDILKSLCYRWNPQVLRQLQKEFDDFYALREQAMDGLQSFLSSLVGAYGKKNLNRGLVNKIRHDYAKIFKRDNLKLQIQHAKIIELIRNQGGRRVVDCLYQGFDRIN